MPLTSHFSCAATAARTFLPIRTARIDGARRRRNGNRLIWVARSGTPQPVREFDGYKCMDLRKLELVCQNQFCFEGDPDYVCTCQGGRVPGDAGQDGLAALSCGGTPVPQDGPGTQAGDSGLGDGRPHYGGDAREKKEQVVPVSVFVVASQGISDVAGDKKVPFSQHLLRSVPPRASDFRGGDPSAGRGGIARGRRRRGDGCGRQEPDRCSRSGAQYAIEPFAATRVRPRSEHDHWVYGYGYEVVVTAGKNSTVFPLLA